MKDYNIKQELNKIVSLCIDKGRREIDYREDSYLECEWIYEKNGYSLSFIFLYYIFDDSTYLLYPDSKSFSQYFFEIKDSDNEILCGFDLDTDLVVNPNDLNIIIDFIKSVKVLGFYDE